MIDEGTLAGLLTAHAERIPVPPSAIDALLAASPRNSTAVVRRFARPSSRMLAAAATAVVAVVAGTVWAVAGQSGGPSASKTVSVNSRSVARPLSGFLPSSVRNDLNAGIGAVHGSAGNLAGTTSSQSRAKPAAGVAAAPTDTAKVVRTGTLDLRVARHGFGTTIGRITTVAAAAGGFVSDAKTYESAAIPSGVVTIRIPSSRFNATVNQLRKLGTVVSASTQGVDVTGHYTDLQARLRASNATRDQFLTVLSQATNIGDILAVQDRIQAVQTQIEQLQGQIQQLDDQTSYGTLTISVVEPGPRPKPLVGPKHRSGLAIAWDNARNGFTRRIEGLISHSGSALVLLLGLFALVVALRFLVPRARRLLV